MRQIAGKHAIHARPLQHHVLQTAFVPFQRELPFPREQHVLRERVVPPPPNRGVARELVGQKPRRALRADAAETLDDRNRGYFVQDRRRLDQLRELCELRRLCELCELRELRRLGGLGGVESPGQIGDEFLERLGGVQREQRGREVAEQGEKEKQGKRGVAENEHLVEAAQGERGGPANFLAKQLGVEEGAEEPGGGDPAFSQRKIKTRTLDRDGHVEGVREPGRGLIETRSLWSTVMKSSPFSMS